MKNFLSLLVASMIIVTWLAMVHAAQVCIEHEGRNLLIDDKAMNDHVTKHGDTVVDAVNCIDACIDHQGKIMAVSKDALQGHLDHGDKEVNVAECLS